MTNSITNRQMFFMIFLTLTTYTTIDLPKIMAQTAGRSSWIPIMAASVVFGGAAVIITKLNNMYQGKVLFDYSQEIVGKIFSRLIASYYVLFFLIVGVYLKLKLVGMLKSNFLPQTPQFIMLLMGISLFGYVAYKGITNVARMFEIIGILFLIVTVGLCVAMLLQGMTYNILPFFNRYETKEYMKTMKDLVTPFTGLAVLFVIPFTSQNQKAPKVAFCTLIFIGLLYILIVESTIMILGINNTIVFNDAFIEAIKIVELPVIERTDIFYLTFGLTSLFAGMIIVFTVIVEFACRFIPKVKRHIVVIAIGIIFFSLCLFALNINNMRAVFESFAPSLVIISTLLIPTLLLIIGQVKKRTPQKPRAGEGGRNNETT
ncbi:MAG: GerAB/ArcD/ProY family transporter [Desulfitobacterium sp.]